MVRFSSIGDVVLTTPVVRCLKEQVPQAEIHFLTKAPFACLFDNNPHIAAVHTIQRSIEEVLPNLQAQQFDFVVDLHNNVRTLSLKRKLGVRSSAFPKKNIGKFLLTNFKVNTLPDLHVVDRYFEAVRVLGVTNDQLPGELFLSEQDVVSDLPFEVAESFVAVAMGAQFGTKQLPMDLLEASLCNIQVPIVLLGGTMDAQRSAELTHRFPEKRIFDLCGKLQLRQSAWVLKHATVLLTGDTGLMHVAACFRVPIVSVWGNTVPAFGMYPYAPQEPSLFSLHEVPGLRCRPCSKIGYQSCPKKHFRCMQDQDSDAISAALKERLD